MPDTQQTALIIDCKQQGQSGGNPVARLEERDLLGLNFRSNGGHLQGNMAQHSTLIIK